MTQYLSDGPMKFSVGSREYRDSWDRMFGKPRWEGAVLAQHTPISERDMLEEYGASVAAEFRAEICAALERHGSPRFSAELQKMVDALGEKLAAAEKAGY